MKKKSLAIVLLSGGLDSAVALYWAKRRDYEIQTLTFNYYLRSKKEIKATEDISRLNGFKQNMIKLDFLKEVEDSETKNPLLKDAEGAYVPARNIIFYGIASYLAEICDATHIIGGHNKDDVKEFPDSSIPFFKHFNSLTKLGLISNGKTGRVLLPLARLSKTEVVKLGARLEVPFELTWSCHFSHRNPCGSCYACKLRASAFREAGISDPLVGKFSRGKPAFYSKRMKS